MENGELLVCRYDAEGLRHEMEENGRLIKFIYRDRDVVLEESEESGPVRYIKGNGKLIASDSEKARTYYHYVSDNIGSVCYVVDRKDADIKETSGLCGEIFDEGISSNDKAFADRIKCYYEYDAFGNVIEAEESIENRFRFAGECVSWGWMNLHAYVGNNPKDCFYGEGQYLLDIVSGTKTPA